AGDDMVARHEQHHRAMRSGHAGGKRQSAAALFERGERGLEIASRGVGGSRIVEIRGGARLWLNEGGCHVDRRNHGASAAIRFLANVNRTSAKLHKTSWRHASAPHG